MRQAENKVRIEGILSEVDIQPGSFTKNGNIVESIGGVIKIKVDQEINGEKKSSEIPVHMFASKMTNKGTPNPAYESIQRVMNEFTSIAAAGNEDDADRVRITSGQIQMNEYYANGNPNLVSFPRITASFITKVKKEEFNPETVFNTEFVVISKGYETDKDGIETDKYKIVGALPQYGEKVDVIPFYALSPGVINAVSQYWGEADTVKASGRLNFTSRTEKIVHEVDFGEPTVETRTINVSELVITGGSQTPCEGEFAYTPEEIKKGMVERKARLEAQKTKDAEKASKNNSGKKAPAKSGGFDKDALGF